MKVFSAEEYGNSERIVKVSPKAYDTKSGSGMCYSLPNGESLLCSTRVLKEDDE